MGRIPKYLLSVVVLLTALLLAPGLTHLALAQGQEVSGTVTEVQDYVVVVNGGEYQVTSSSMLEGVEVNNLADLEGQQVEISYIDEDGRNTVTHLRVV